MRQRTGPLSPYGWGLTDIAVNAGLAEHGKFGLDRCAGVMPDGLPFLLPGDAPPPPPLDLPSDTRDAVIYLTLPAQQPGGLDFEMKAEADASVRHVVEETDVIDSFSRERLAERIETATPQLRYGVTRDQIDGRERLGLARVREVLNGKILFDEGYIPPVLDLRASPSLVRFLTDADGRSGQRIDELSVRAAVSASGGADTLVPFLMLQVLNRWRPVLGHLSSLPNIHPERLYETFLSLVGELSTFTRDERRAPPFPAYDHENLQICFETVFEALQTDLSVGIDRAADQIPLEEVGAGAYRATITDPSIFQTCSLYLAATARVPPDQLRSLASVVKIGSIGKMRDIVSSSLQAGVRILPTQTPPPQIRPMASHIYFELDRSSPEWRDLAKAPALGLHVAGEWPGLALELWWVRRTGR